MVDIILNSLYTSDVIDKMGGWYDCVYSWSAFTIVVSYVLISVIAFLGLIVWFGRWFK